MAALTESIVEAAATEWLTTIAWQVAHRSYVTSGAPGEEQDRYGHVVLECRLRDGLVRLNASLPEPALEDQTLADGLILSDGFPTSPHTSDAAGLSATLFAAPERLSRCLSVALSHRLL